MGFETQDVERKTLSILRVLQDSPDVIGGRMIARRLKDHGVDLGERAVRYHLKLMDKRGLTELKGRDGRVLTKLGRSEVKNAMVSDKVGFAISKIELLSFLTDFDCDTSKGMVPVNVSLFSKSSFDNALKIMRPIFCSGLCVSDLVAVAEEGERIGDVLVPNGKIALATVCSVIINGVMLKAGIPVNSAFGGILQVRNHRPIRFVELIHYAGSSLDPSDVFIRANMTTVQSTALTGQGEILANFRDIPATCLPLAEKTLAKLENAGISGVMIMGQTSEQLCEVPVDLNRIGIILLGGLNPVAAAHEAGINGVNYAMSTIIDYRDLIRAETI
jgi:HTH-type transcriptional regulator, global nitrogen regulator NrpRI